MSSAQTQAVSQVRALANPPSKIKKTMEAVCTLMGHKDLNWKAIKRIMSGSTFISDIINFDAETINSKLREKLKKTYLNDEEFVFEVVNRASKACGPLCKWFRAIVNYSDILHRVEPLRAELAKYEKECSEMQAQQAELEELLGTLEASIASYKVEYAALIAETQRIAEEMETTKVKVERSTRLLSSLSSEKVRWESEADGFRSQIASVTGDVLIAAATMAYAGYFDQKYRLDLARAWKSHLRKAGVQFKDDLNINEFLCEPAEVLAGRRVCENCNTDRCCFVQELAWQSEGLPVDGLCTENAIMLNRFNRYPLLIDPSGQVKVLACIVGPALLVCV